MTSDPAKRQTAHKYCAARGDNCSFYRAIRVHKWESFEYFVLEADLTREEAFESERFFIAASDSYRNGYNETTGGNGSSYTEEQRAKLSLARKGRKQKEETKRKISEARKGLKCTEEVKEKISTKLTGRVFSEETLAKMSAGQKKRVWGPKSEETKQRMRKPKSPKHKEAIKASWVLRREKKQP